MQGTITTSHKRTPEYLLYRVVTAVDGAGELTKKGNGLNMQGKKTCCLQFIPITNPNPPPNPNKNGDIDPAGLTLGTSNPVVTIRFWSETAQRFIVQQPAIALTAPGAGVPAELVFEANGRIIFAEVTGGLVVGESILIYAAGFQHEELAG